MTSLIYWISRLSILSSLFYKAALLSAALIVLSLIISSIGNSEEDIDPTVFKRFKKRLWIPVIFYLLHALTPTTKEALLIGVSGKVLNYVEKDTCLQQIPFDITKAISDKIKSSSEKRQNVDSASMNLHEFSKTNEETLKELKFSIKSKLKDASILQKKVSQLTTENIPSLNLEEKYKSMLKNLEEFEKLESLKN